MKHNLRGKAKLSAALRRRTSYRAEQSRGITTSLFQGFIAAGATALVAALVIGSLSLAGIIDMAPAYTALVAAWFVVVLALAIPKPKWKWAAKRRLSYSMGITAIASIVFFFLARYELLNRPLPDKGEAILSLRGLDQIADPRVHYTTVNAQINNIGNTFALRPAIILSGKFLRRLLTSSETAGYMNRVAAEVEQADKMGPNKSQIAPQTGAPVTLTDPDNHNTTIEFTPDDWNDFTNGKAIIYVFEISHYEDPTIESSGFWEQSTCAYFFESLSYWHNCAPNNTLEKDTPRFAGH